MKEHIDVLTYRLVPKKENPLFESDVIYGPIISKRSFHSIGINLWPQEKVCSFDCIYCHCGKSSGKKDGNTNLELIKNEIQRGFAFHSKNNAHIQDILMEGNGEPTEHPNFKEISDYIREKRDVYFPKTSLVLFTNSTKLDEEETVRTILDYDQVFFKLDAADDETLKRINNYRGSLDRIIRDLKRMGNIIRTNRYSLKNFEISTAVIGSDEGNIRSLSGDDYSEIIKELQPQKLYLYNIDRIVPNSEQTYKITFEELKRIGEEIFKKTNIEIIMLHSEIGRGTHELSRLNR